jgi:glutamyl-Q tRNA(Asp) synthetase
VKSSSATGTITAEPAPPYRGRFAPSPTGPLHFGSLIAAVGSFLEARTRSGQWLVRIEDLDPPRERPGAAEQILRTLEALGLHWDGPVMRQSARAEAYEGVLRQLETRMMTFRCHCSRSALARLPENRERGSAEELFHPPGCVGHPGDADGASVRFRAADRPGCFDDRSLGRQSGNVARSSGDFVLKRRDGLYAYQLAVVVDDADQGITDIVRGADLLHSTPRQIQLQNALRIPRPGYMHLPLAVRPDGDKLSKSADAPGAGTAAPAMQISRVLAFLGQEPPEELGQARLAEVWAWAIEHWRPERFAGVRQREAGADILTVQGH